MTKIGWIATKKYFKVVQFELMRLYELQHELRALSYFDLMRRMRLTITMFKVILSLPIMINLVSKGQISAPLSSSTCTDQRQSTSTTTTKTTASASASTSTSVPESSSSNDGGILGDRIETALRVAVGFLDVLSSTWTKKKCYSVSSISPLCLQRHLTAYIHMHTYHVLFLSSFAFTHSYLFSPLPLLIFKFKFDSTYAHMWYIPSIHSMRFFVRIDCTLCFFHLIYSIDSDNTYKDYYACLGIITKLFGTKVLLGGALFVTFLPYDVWRALSKVHLQDYNNSNIQLDSCMRSTAWDWIHLGSCAAL